jgi:hypothetical protein
MRTAKFNGVRVAEMTVSFLNAAPDLKAKAAFINTRTGQTHGWTTGTHWSRDTQELLAELRQSMERDIEALHFADGAVTDEEPGHTAVVASPGGGLGEHLAGDSAGDVPQG